jgi:hypothetical protein
VSLPEQGLIFDGSPLPELMPGTAQRGLSECLFRVFVASIHQSPNKLGPFVSQWSVQHIAASVAYFHIMLPYEVKRSKTNII